MIIVVAGAVQARYVDHIYMAASRGDRNLPGHFILYLIVILPLIGALKKILFDDPSASRQSKRAAVVLLDVFLVHYLVHIHFIAWHHWS